MEIRLQWIVLGVYPPATFAFWLLYFYGWAPITRRFLSARRAGLANVSGMQSMCWRANCNSCLHTATVVLVLVPMLASDDEMWRRRLHPHVNMAGHAVMSISLAYFSFAIPWQWRLYFCKGERQAVKLELVIHHVLVVLGILTYLLTSVCAVYGAVAFACMEFTNWFFVPYTMMSQIGLDDGGARYTAVGVLLVVSFIVCRIGICTWQGVEFSKDLADFSSADRVEWAFVLLAFSVYMAALGLSWIWLRRVLSECKDGVNEILKENNMHILPRRRDRKVEPQVEGTATRVPSPAETQGAAPKASAAPGILPEDTHA